MHRRHLPGLLLLVLCACVRAEAALPVSEIRLSVGAVEPREDFRDEDLALSGLSIHGSYAVYLAPRLALGFGGGYTGNDALDRVNEGMEHYHRRYATFSAVVQLRLQLLAAGSSPYLLARIGAHRWTERVLARGIDGMTADIFGPLMADAIEFGWGWGAGAQVIGDNGSGLFLEAFRQHIGRGYLPAWEYVEVRMGVILGLSSQRE
jgi:opacity protein-like surface antigen